MRPSGTAVSRAAVRERQAARRGPPPFASNDLQDLSALVAKLHSQAEPVSQFLWTRFSEATRQALANFKGRESDPRTAEKLLIDELNAIALGELIYERQRFAAITFSRDTRILLTQRPRGQRLARLNRLLLGDAFPKELRNVALRPDLRQTAYRAARPVSGTTGDKKLSPKKMLLYMAVFVLVLACGLWMAKPVYRAYKKWNAERSLIQATAFMEKTDYRNASLAARKVLSLLPTSVGATRILAQLAELSGLPDAIKWRQRLVELEPTVVSNKLDLARTALALRNPFLAQMTLEGIAETNRNTSEYHQIVAMLEITIGRIPQAEKHLAEASKIEPDNKLLQLNLAVLHLQSEDPAIAGAAEMKLLELAEEPKTRRGALQHLIQFASQKKNFPRAQQLSEKLIGDPEAKFEDRLLHLSILDASKAGTFTDFLAALQKESEQRPEHIGAFANWMVASQRAAEALRWLLALPDDTRQQQPVTIAITDCYISLQDWAKLEEFLKEKNWENQEFLRYAVLAGAAAKQKDEAKAKTLWLSAVDKATPSLRALQALLRMTHDWRWDREREDLLWLIAERFPTEGLALQALEDWFVQKGDTRGLNKLYTHLVNSNLKEVSESLKYVVMKNNLASTLMLLKLQLPRAYELAREVYQVKPENAAFATTYAFAAHLQSNTVEGIRIMEKLKPEMLEIPGVAAYYGVLLAANGDAVKAKKYLEIAQKSKLLPEEQALVKQALKP